MTKPIYCRLCGERIGKAFIDQKNQEDKRLKPYRKECKIPLEDGYRNKLIKQSGFIIEQINNLEKWQEKIKLSDNGKSDFFINAFLDYLDGLPDKNRQIEICNNLIKICRNRSIELQQVKRGIDENHIHT